MLLSWLSTQLSVPVKYNGLSEPAPSMRKNFSDGVCALDCPDDTVTRVGDGGGWRQQKQRFVSIKQLNLDTYTTNQNPLLKGPSVPAAQ